MERAIRHTTANGRMLQASLESSIANRIQSATYNARCELETLRLRCRALEYHIREREILLDNESQQLAREQDMAVGVSKFLVAISQQFLHNSEVELSHSV